MDLNITNASCLTQYENFGSTVFVNICNGKEVVVPWGFGGWAILGFVSLCILGCAFIIYNAVTYEY